jgi:phosphate transport system substrate-binding protein
MRIISILAAVSVVASCSKPAPSVPVTADGSSTVYPLTEAAAELFEKSSDATVSVAFSGSVVGFGRFCRGQLDILDASRPINRQEQEQELCQQQQVTFLELPVAHDAVTIIVNAWNTWATSITVDELRKIWEPKAEKQITRWNQIRKDWPNRELMLFGPGTESGTFEFFNQAINGASDKSRKDYAASGDDRTIVEGVASSEGALGYVGHAQYLLRRERLKALAVDDLNDRIGPGPIEPTAENVSRGTYQPLGRPLFIYVNTKGFDRPEVKAFVSAYVRNARDLATSIGAVPLMPSTHKLVEERLAKRATGTVFNVPNLAEAWLDLLLTQ